MSSIFKYAATLVGGQSHKAQQSGPGSTRVGTDPQIDPTQPKERLLRRQARSLVGS